MRRWVRYPFGLVLMVWFVIMIHIDHELMLLIFNGRETRVMQPLKPRSNFPWWRNAPHGSLVRRMIPPVTEDRATVYVTVQEKKNYRNDEEGNIKWGNKEGALNEPARRKIGGKSTKVYANVKRILDNVLHRNNEGARNPQRIIAQERSTNSKEVIPWVEWASSPEKSVLPEVSIWKDKKVLSETKKLVSRMEIPRPLMRNIMLEEATIPQTRSEMLAEDGKSKMPKERTLTKPSEEKLIGEGTSIVAVGINNEKTEKENMHSEHTRMQTKEEETLTLEEIISEQIPGDAILDTVKGKITTEGRNLTLKKESPKLEINATITPPVASKVASFKISHEIDKIESSLTEEQIKNVRENIRKANEAQEILNKQVFGPVLKNTTVLLVQVHKRLENLRYLVKSMEAVSGINESLVIFSHDLWDPTINTFVRNITSFRVLQIFFPFSIQLHPRRFPGTDPRDCAWNATRFFSQQTCIGQPDTYGHFREAGITQIKHHWWWKINRVFEELQVTRESTGRVVFLEEDYYLAPDFLHVLQLLLKQRSQLCQQCQLICLGNHKRLNVPTFSNRVITGDWMMTQHNLGYALDRSTWGIIKSCQEFFCTFDDYNWDWTLHHLVQTCGKPKLAMIAVVLSRVRHIGSCGTHIKKKTCDIKSEARLVEQYYQANAQWLFPTSFKTEGLYKRVINRKKVNGGWSDHRDHQLCKDMAHGNASENSLLKVSLSDTVLVTKLPDTKKLVE